MSDENEKGRGASLRLIIGLLVVVVGVYAFIDSMTQGGVYYLTVDEAYQQYLVTGAEAPTRPVRIKGTVVEGTWKHQENATTHSFVIKGDAQRIDVFYDGPMPDVFGEGREVTAEGRLDDAGLLTATEVTAKCPSKYEGGAMSEAAMKRAGLEGAEQPSDHPGAAAAPSPTEPADLKPAPSGAY